jgi:periplasmic protein TonB
MKQLLLSFFCISFLIANAQDKNQFYALDAQMNQTVLDSSKYILWIHEKDSARWQWDYYYTWGPLVKSTTYADHDGTVKNGRFCIYNTFGNLDSTGIYENGKKNGLFLKLRSVTKDSIEFISQYEYQQDSLVRFKNLLVGKNNQRQKDTTRELESEYPGGRPEWLSYVTNNLKYPERALNKDIQGSVRVCFLVDTTGVVRDPFIVKSIEYSLDQESIRLIRNSGKWVSGQKGGIPITTYKIEPVNYKLERH